MNANIKTGREIHKQSFSNYGAGEHQRIQKDMEAKWVSVEWLKEQVKEYQKKPKSILSHDCCDWLLHLLEG